MDNNRPVGIPPVSQGQQHGPTGGASPAGPSGGLPVSQPRPPAPGIILPNAGQHASPSTPGQQPRPAVPNRIQQSRPGIGPVHGGPVSMSGTSPMEEALKPLNRLGEDAKPLPVAEGMNPAGAGGKITAFGGKSKRHEDSWTRSPNTTGNGAIHVKTFHCKLTDDALAYLDQGINEWLDAHPQYEVKFVSTSIGIMTGKLKEPALICQVWV
jgi:hypothetical protein